MQTTTKLKKWGNSLAIRIPQAVVADLGLSIDSSVQITSSDKVMTLKPESAKKVNLVTLLAKITPENLPKEADWGEPVGKEVW